MSVERINPAELGPASGFSHAVVTPPGARIVYLAGQTAQDETGRMVPGDLVEEFERALKRLLTALTAAGGKPESLAKMVIYVRRPDEYRARSAELGEVWRKLVGRNYPAMTLVGVSGLWDPEALVELEAFAVLDAAS